MYRRRRYSNGYGNKQRINNNGYRKSYSKRPALADNLYIPRVSKYDNFSQPGNFVSRNPWPNVRPPSADNTYVPREGKYNSFSPPRNLQHQQPEPPKTEPEEPRPRDKNDELIEDLINYLKDCGVYDSLRKLCLNEAELKESYKKLMDNINTTVDDTVKKIKWNPQLNRIKIRENMRTSIEGSKYFKPGLDKLVAEMVHKDGDPKYSPIIEEAVDKFIGAKKHEKEDRERAEQDRLEKEKLRQEKIEKTKEERARREQERKEKERLEKERQERERLEKENQEQEKLERIRLEKERLEQERLERERLDREKHQEEMMDQGSDYEDSSDDESPMFEPILQASPPRVTREEIEQKFSLEMQEELRRLAVIQNPGQPFYLVHDKSD